MLNITQTHHQILQSYQESLSVLCNTSLCIVFTHDVDYAYPLELSSDVEPEKDGKQQEMTEVNEQTPLCPR